MTDPEILAAWQSYHRQVMRVTAEIVADPIQAVAHGVVVHLQKGEPDEAGIMREVAKAIIPAEFEWEIMVAIGGKSYLLLKKHTDSAAHPE
jgi:hypothetical protein